MAEGLGLGLGQDDSFAWVDNQSWSFPDLLSTEDNNSGKFPALDDHHLNPHEPKEEGIPDPAPSPGKGTRKRKAAAGSSGGGGGGGEGGGGESDDHELHIWTERERRKKMRNMFSNLHALLPHLPPKADKSSIVDEAVRYIKKMQQTLEKLQKHKAQVRSKHHHNLAFQTTREAFLAADPGVLNPPVLNMGPQYPPVFKTWTSPNVTLNVCGEEAHISVCGIKKAGLLTAICYVAEKYKLQVVSAQVSSDAQGCMYMFHTRANGGVWDDQRQEGFPSEEIYKLAAAEMMQWVNA